MFDYIKKRIQTMQPEYNGSSIEEIQENDAIMECAHLIQELDDLSITGSEINQMRDIDALNISLDDDIELDSIEVSISGGQILDSPADVLVHSEHYEHMKSEDDFITEAVNVVRREFMEGDKSYNARVMEHANRNYEMYKQQIIQEGLFSSNKIGVMDTSIQWYRNIDFGPSDINDPSSAPYVAKLEIAYFPANNSRTKIMVKQRDSIFVIVDAFPDIFKSIGQFYMEYLSQHGYEIPKGKKLWDIVIPKKILVPIEPIDKFCIVIEAENLVSTKKQDDNIYCGFSVPIKRSKSKSFVGTDSETPGSKEITKASVTRDENPHITLNKNLINQTAAFREAYREKTSIGRVVQEAIDFGDDSTPPGGDNGGDNGGNATTNPEPAATDIPAATDDISADAQEPTATVTSNDISSQIADKVEEKSEEQNAEINGDTGTVANATGDGLDSPATDIPDDMTDNPDMDTSSLDVGGDEGSIDDRLNSLNAMGNTESELEDTNTAMGADVADMSPDDLKNAVIDKVNKMPISQIQAFLAGGDDTATDMGGEPGDDGTLTEAFVLTKKNINAELDVCLRRCLGDLNDTSKSLDEILTAFKKDGKKLNRALTKASKMTDVYKGTERNQFTKLNKCTADLIVSFNASKMDVKVTKRLIKAFASTSVGVGKIIDSHKGDTNSALKRVVD